jgi:hypothetical protein
MKIKIEIKASKRARHISLTIIDSEKVKVTVPYRLRNHQDLVFKIVEEKKDWIKKQMQKFKQKNRHRLNLPDRIESNGQIIAGTQLKFWAKQKIIYNTKLLAEKLKFRINKIYIRNQKTRWGSCSSRGNLSLNYRIALLPDDLFEYIILHELMHLKHPHHQKAFWQDLEYICAGVKEKRQKLKLYSLR